MNNRLSDSELNKLTQYKKIIFVATFEFRALYENWARALGLCSEGPPFCLGPWIREYARYSSSIGTGFVPIWNNQLRFYTLGDSTFPRR